MAWHRCGRRGVIEAVTGSGKTDVALTAIEDAVGRGLFALVIVPSRVLMEQWFERLGRWMPDVEIGRLGDGYRDRPIDCDVLITTRHSAASRVPLPTGTPIAKPTPIFTKVDVDALLADDDAEA